MNKRIVRSFALALFIVILLALPVLAYTYYAPLQVVENGTAAHTMVGLNDDVNNTWLANNGFITASARDTRVGTLGGINKPHMVTNNKVFFATAVPLNGQINLYYTTGNTAADYYIVPGYGGSFYRADTPTMEIGNDGKVELKAYVNTGTAEAYLRKPNAFSLTSDGAGNVVATIGQDASSLAQVIYGGSDDAIAPTTTEYNVLMGGGVDANWNATESVNYQVMPTAGTISQLYIKMSATPAAGTAIFTLMKNGAPQALTVTIANPATTGSDLTNSVSFVAGDTVSLRYVTSGASGTPYAQWSTLWTSTVANESIFLLNATAVIAGTEYFLPQGNGGTGIATEDYAYTPMPTAGTFKKMYVQLSADPGNAPDNYRFYLRKNAVDTALTVNIIADATTGNDIADTVAVVADDLISVSVVPENVPAVAPYAAIGMVFSPTVIGESVVMGGGINNSPDTAATNYGFLSGNNKGAAAWSATEATQNQLTQLTVISKLYVKLRQAPDNGAGVQSYTFNVREAVGNTGLTVTVSEAATTGNDTTHTYTSANGAVTDMAVVPAGTPLVTWVRWGLVSRYPSETRTVAVASGDRLMTATLAEKILNPSFETGTPPTSWTPSGSTFTRSNTQIHSGSFSGKQVAGGGATNFILQNFGAVAPTLYRGKTITVSIWYWANVANDKNQTIDLTDDAGSTTSAVLTKDSAWHQVSLTRAIDIATNNVYLRAFTTNGAADADDELYTDDASMQIFTLTVDATSDISYISGLSVPNNGATWNWYPVYTEYYKHYVPASTLVVYYQPNAIISGTTLPDREVAVATENATFVFGANPAGVTVTLGSMLSTGQPTLGGDITDPARDLLPEAGTGSDWYVDPDVTGALLTNPMRPFVTILSDTTTLTEILAWRLLGLAFVLLVLAMTLKAVRGHVGIAGITAGVATGAMVVMTIFPLWALVFAIAGVVGGLVMERTPSL